MRVAVVSGLDYGSPEAVRSAVQSLPPSSTIYLTARSSVSGICKDEATLLHIPYILAKWPRYNPNSLVRSIDALIVFIDDFAIFKPNTYGNGNKRNYTHRNSPLISLISAAKSLHLLIRVYGPTGSILFNTLDNGVASPSEKCVNPSKAQ